MTNVITHYRTDQAKNQAYPVEQDFPLTGHIEKTANIKKHKRKRHCFPEKYR